MHTDTASGVVLHDVGDTLGPLATYVNVSAVSIAGILAARQKQTYYWANAAARTSQTGMLDGAEGYQADTRAAWKYNGPTTTWLQQFTGYFIVPPSSISVTAGSSVINADGSATITFTGTGNAIINNIFPTVSTYGTDCADVNITVAGSASNVSLRLCVGGVVDPSGANHDLYGPTYTQAGTPTNNTSLNQISWTPIGGAIGADLRWGVDHANATLSTTTFLNGRTWATVGTAETSLNIFMNHRLATAYDGFQIIVTAACVVTVRVHPRP